MILMAQLHSTGDVDLDKEVRVLSYQAIIDCCLEGPKLAATQLEKAFAPS